MLPCARCRCPCTCRNCSCAHRLLLSPSWRPLRLLSPLWSLSLSLIIFVLFLNAVGYVVPWITSFSRSYSASRFRRVSPSHSLAVVFHLLLSRSYAYGSGSTSLYPEGRGLVLAVTVVSLWVRNGGVEPQGFVLGRRYNVVALESTGRYCITT